MSEAEVVERVSRAARRIADPLEVVIGAPLLYQVTVSDNVQITVDPGA